MIINARWFSERGGVFDNKKDERFSEGGEGGSPFLLSAKKWSKFPLR